MDGIRTWSAAVCMAALGCAAIRLLAPKDGIGKVFRLVVTTFFLCCMILPLLKVGSFEALEIDGLPEAVVSDLLEDTVTQQLEEQVRAAVTALAEEALSQRDIVAEKIDVTTDISAEGSIYIQHVALTVDKQNVPIAKVVGEVLAEQLKAPVEVKTM